MKLVVGEKQRRAHNPPTGLSWTGGNAFWVTRGAAFGFESRITNNAQQSHKRTWQCNCNYQRADLCPTARVGQGPSSAIQQTHRLTSSQQRSCLRPDEIIERCAVCVENLYAVSVPRQLVH